MHVQARSWLRRLFLLQMLFVGLVALASERAERLRRPAPSASSENGPQFPNVRRTMSNPSAMQAEYAVLHDARSTHDVASVSFDDYQMSGRSLWIVATISPNAKSGSATIPGGYFEADGGKLVVPSGAQTSIVKVGTWKALASASPSIHPEGGASHGTSRW